jgi:uncharacterized Zn finger protein (UPF0148 family)
MSKFLCPKCRLPLEGDDGTTVQCAGCEKSFVFCSAKGKEHPERADDLLESWQGECEKAVRMVSNLLTLAGRWRGQAAIIELLRSVPRTAEDVRKLPENSLLARCAAEAFERKTERNARMMDEIVDYLKYLVGMEPHRRAMLEASVAGVFLGSAMAE